MLDWFVAVIDASLAGGAGRRLVNALRAAFPQSDLSAYAFATALTMPRRAKPSSVDKWQQSILPMTKSYSRCPSWVKSGNAHNEPMMSAFTPLATFERTFRDVGLVPIGDIALPQTREEE
jgi:hypothetical protein